AYQPRLSCEGADDPLEKGVDRAYGKLGVSVQDGLLRFEAAFAERRLVQPKFLFQFIRQVVRFRPGKLVETFQDTVLHFLRRLVGKGDGQNMTEILCLVLQRQLQIRFGKRARFTRTRRTPVDGEWGIHRSKENALARQLLSIAVKSPRIIQVDIKGPKADFRYGK